MIEELRKLLKKHEGCILHAYRDSLGFWTCGFGHKLPASLQNPESLTITQDQAESWLIQDMARALREVRWAVPHFDDLDAVRQCVLADMAFNLGIQGLMKFKKMLSAVDEGSFITASSEMLDSLWRKQVGDRARELAVMMATGEYPEWLTQ